MDKTIMGLLGGASALALLGGSQASAASPLDEVNMLQPARSFAELLDPIPNAGNVLRAENERAADATVAEEKRPILPSPSSSPLSPPLLSPSPSLSSSLPPSPSLLLRSRLQARGEGRARRCHEFTTVWGKVFGKAASISGAA
jgi:hypothetical protein